MVEDDQTFTVTALVKRLGADYGSEAETYAVQRIADELTALIPMPAAQVLALAQSLREARRRRMTRTVGEKLVAASNAGAAGAVELVEQAQEEIAGVASLLWTDGPGEKPNAELDAALDALITMHETPGAADPLAMPTPYHDLNKLLTMRPSDAVVIAGVTSVGKSTLAVNVGEYAAAQGKRVILFTLEMSARQVHTRRLVSESLLPLNFWRGYEHGPPDWHARAQKARDKISARPFVIHYAAGLNVTAIRAAARREKVKAGLDLVIVDYLQLVQPPRETDSRANDVAAISRGLKMLAMELDVCVLALSQLSRMPATRKHGEPVLSDLRESGAVEQDANAVILLWKHPEDAQGIVRAKVAKQRDGAVGTVNLFHDEQHFTFKSLATPKQQAASEQGHVWS
jgi:replicative DNA helicase